MATQLKDLSSIEAILNEMTVEEKARIVIGGSPFCSEAMSEYGIPEMFLLDSCNGFNSMEAAGDKIYHVLAAQAAAAGKPMDREQFGYMGGLLLAIGALQKKAMEAAASGAAPSPKPLGCYPPGIAMGSTWNPEVLEQCGHQIAKEMGSYGVDVVLGPNVNIHRDPRCGRLGESFSEDPYLVGQLASALIRGMQAEGVAACVKHYAANNQEKDRLGVEEHISERALREIYLPGFQAAVDAGCKTIMSAYNQINGVPSAQNKWLLKDILRKEWNFEGMVVSDWGASYDLVKAIAAGTDLTMPGPRGIQEIKKAVLEDRTLTMEELDDCVRHVLRVVLETPAMTGNRPAFKREETLGAMEAVLRESMILLKNDGTLPLALDTDVTILGKRSRKPAISPAGSSNVDTDLTTNLYDSVAALIGAEHVTENAKTLLVTVGSDGREGEDRETLAMDADDAAVLEDAIAKAQTAGGKVIVVINATGPIDLNAYEKRVNAILCPFLPGIQGGKVTAEAVFGKFNPSGKLAMTWPKHEYDCPAYKNFGGENKEVWYGEGIYVGYRWYDMRHIEPAYPFGYGLSYTSFEITDAVVPDSINVDKTSVPVTVTVKNTGNFPGSEVIQVYVRDVECVFDRPDKELKGFQKVFLAPGEEKTVQIELPKTAFQGYYMEFGQWIAQPGEFDILIGTSSRNIAVQKRIFAKCADPFGISFRSSIGKIAKDPEAVRIVNEAIEEDILLLAKVALEYAPDKSLDELWQGKNIKGALRDKGWDDGRIAEAYDLIAQGFAAMQENCA